MLYSYSTNITGIWSLNDMVEGTPPAAFAPLSIITLKNKIINTALKVTKCSVKYIISNIIIYLARSFICFELSMKKPSEKCPNTSLPAHKLEHTPEPKSNKVRGLKFLSSSLMILKMLTRLANSAADLVTRYVRLPVSSNSIGAHLHLQV